MDFFFAPFQMGGLIGWFAICAVAGAIHGISALLSLLSDGKQYIPPHKSSYAVKREVAKRLEKWRELGDK